MDSYEVNRDYGFLLNEHNIKLSRGYFKEMVRLLGINVIYRAPLPDKHWTNYGEIDSNFEPPKLVGCIFEDHPNQYTMKKLGWVAELQENSSLISVPYDLKGIQVGALFIVPSGIDKAEGRLFRVKRLSNIMVYPASITCEIVPEYENTYSTALQNYTASSSNLLNDEE